jgi:hypothetical protein
MPEAPEDPDIRTAALEAIRGLIERIRLLEDPAGVTLDLNRGGHYRDDRPCPAIGQGGRS